MVSFFTKLRDIFRRGVDTSDTPIYNPGRNAQVKGALSNMDLGPDSASQQNALMVCLSCNGPAIHWDNPVLTTA